MTPVPAGAADRGDDGVAVAEPFVAATEAGPIPGLFYPPTNPVARGPEGSRPPLVVFCHGGPTGAAEPGFDPLVQFFTSRGLGVAAVNYRGSSGYGRGYRRSLEGLWGVADVDDCTAYAVALAEAGRVDGGNLAIRGTSAGGLTALGALVRTRAYRGAASWYGVTDLQALATDTHDFESRYMDGLVGPLPAAADLYRQRSPLYHPEAVTGAVLLLQGADDPVVPRDQSERFADALSARGSGAPSRYSRVNRTGSAAPRPSKPAWSPSWSFTGRSSLPTRAPTSRRTLQRPRESDEPGGTIDRGSRAPTEAPELRLRLASDAG